MNNKTNIAIEINFKFNFSVRAIEDVTVNACFESNPFFASSLLRQRAYAESLKNGEHAGVCSKQGDYFLAIDSFQGHSFLF